jgi:hypothetical protein
MRKKTQTARKLEDFPTEERDVLEAVMHTTGKSFNELDVPAILEQARAIHQRYQK